MLKCLCDRLGERILFSTLLDIEAVYTPGSDPWMQRVQALVDAAGNQPASSSIVSYFTDAAALRPLMGMPPTVILGPGEPGQAHQTDEYCLVGKIPQAKALYVDLIRDWCRPTA